MKKIYSILFLLIAVSLGFSSCSDDDVVKTQLEAPAISSDITKATSLSFNWQPVAGATQYAYELYDSHWAGAYHHLHPEGMGIRSIDWR